MAIDSSTVQHGLVLTHSHGLHARPCQAIVETLAGFDARVTIRLGSRSADASSILDLMALGAPEGSELELEAVGADSEAAMAALVELFQSDFNKACGDPDESAAP